MTIKGLGGPLLELEGYKPCDCVGTVSETQVAYLLCRAKGKTGQAVWDIGPDEIVVDIEAFLDKYAVVEPPCGVILPDMYGTIKSQLLDGARRARNYVKSHL